MKIKMIWANSTINTLITTVFVSLSLTACSSIDDNVSQLPTTEGTNSVPVAGQDIAQANALLDAGKMREAAEAYFNASQNYRSPERERLMLQAAELSSLLNDSAVTQQFLAPLAFDRLDNENQTRFRLVQAQLALNDRNYRETLRILPQNINNIPGDLGQKILATRMTAAQTSGDKLSLIQELVLQERYLDQPYKVSLNHDRIWGHAQQIPAFQLEEAKNNIGHPSVKSWLSLAQLSRISKNGPISKRQTLRSDLGRWIQANGNHPGMSKAIGLLNASPTTTVTPYTAEAPKATVKVVTAKRPAPKRVVNKPIITSTVRKAPVVNKPAPRVVNKPVPQAPVVKKAVPADPKIRSLYNEIKRKINIK